MLPPAALDHAGQGGADGVEHASDVEGEGEVPLLVLGVEDGALVHEAGAVEQDVERAGVGDGAGDGGRVGGVELVRGDAGAEIGELGLVEVGGDDAGALGGVGEGGGAADALGGGGDEGGLAGEAAWHGRVLMW